MLFRSAVVAAPIAMVDSARLLARIAQKQERDSLARLANRDTMAVRSAIIRYAKAIESGNVVTLRNAFPDMTSQQENNWEKTFFARAEKITAPIRYGATRITRDTAEAEFTLLLNILSKGTQESSVSPLRQRATLVRQSNVWRIVALEVR